MVVSHGGITDEVFECHPLQVPGHELALGEGAKRGGVAYLAAEFHVKATAALRSSG